jgi:hypothetical protein
MQDSASHFVLGAVGVGNERLERVRRVADRHAGGEAVVLAATDELWLGRSTRPGAVLADASSGPRTVAAIGSAVFGGTRVEAGAHASLRRRDTPELATLTVDVEAGWLHADAGPGTQALFVAEAPDGGTVVGSSLAIVAECIGMNGVIDRAAEDFLLGFGFLPDDRTVHPGVRSLRDAQLALGGAPLADDDAGAAAPPPRVSSFDEAVDVLHDLYMEVMEEQAGSARSHAVLLGGFDSALVTATLRRLGHEVATYTFGFGDPTYEQRDVGLVTRSTGSTEHWVDITPEIVGDGLRRFGSTFAQPGPQPHYQIHTLAAAGRIRDDGFDHVFTGDGCDAVFLGYPMVNTRARLVRSLSKVPAPAVRGALAATSLGVADRHLGHVARMSRSTLGNLLMGGVAGGHLPTRYLDDVALRRLRVGPPPAQDESVEEIRRRLAGSVQHLDRTRLAFHGNALTGQSRVKVMGAVGATGVAQSTPFTHPSVAAFVSSLPTEYLRPDGSAAGSSGKALLVEMARRYRLLPDQVIDMPKQSPVDSPIDRWYAGELRPLVFDLLGQLPFEWDRAYVEEILRPRRVEELYRRRISLGHHTFQAVGLLLSYASFAGS